jgi:hypothetical protein
VVNRLTDFPEVSREQIEASLADMAERFKRAGFSMHATHQKRRDVLMGMGDRAGAAAAQRKFLKTRRDWLSDCPACVQDMDGEYQAFLGKDEDAVTRAAPLLAGRLKCTEVPQVTYGKVLVPLCRLGRAQEAMSYHRKGYRLIASNPEFVRSVAHHMTFLVLTGNLTKGLKLLEKHLGEAWKVPNPYYHFEFFLAARFLLDRLAEQGKKTLTLRLPAKFPVHEPSGRYPVAALAAWFKTQVEELAGQFDARNGNPYFSERYAALQELQKQVQPCPLRAAGEPA